MTPRELELRTNLFADLSEEEFNEVIKHRREDIESFWVEDTEKKISSCLWQITNFAKNPFLFDVDLLLKDFWNYNDSLLAKIRQLRVNIRNHKKALNKFQQGIKDIDYDGVEMEMDFYELTHTQSHPYDYRVL